MLLLNVNGERKSFSATLRLSELILKENPEKEKVAVAVNGEFIPKQSYQEIALKDGDQVDIVRPVGGG